MIAEQQELRLKCPSNGKCKKPKIILDPGSCHHGLLSVSRKLIDRAVELGVDAVKFQLFGGGQCGSGNIALPYEYFPKLVKYGEMRNIEIFASIWDIGGLNALLQNHCRSIKFAFSQNNSELIWDSIMSKFDNVYVSTDTIANNYPKCVKMLFCVPSYPVTQLIDFGGLFPDLFQGFSDHSLGAWQSLIAVKKGAEIIEKHYQLDNYNVQCHDAKFALKGKNLEYFVEAVKDGKNPIGAEL